MTFPRVIPVLLLKNKGLVKTTKFKNPVYLGDPFNAVKIFNEKEVDELFFLDIDASKEDREPPYNYLQEVASECFMPLGYGGGVKNIQQIKRLIQSGIEKITINTQAYVNPDFIKEATESYGSSTIVGAMDVKKNLWGKYHVYVKGGTVNTNMEPVEYAQKLQHLGVGEVFLNNIDRDGMMQGYDIDLIRLVSQAVDVPVVACGGAGKFEDLILAIKDGNATAAAAGSLFVFHGKHKAVLITYPEYQRIKDQFTNG